MTVGRQAGVFLLLDHGSISRRHAELRYANGQYVLHDMGSTNGTSINDVQLAANSTTILKPNDRISFGKDIAFTFQLRTGSLANETDKRARPEAGNHARSGDLTIHSMKTGFFDIAAACTDQSNKSRSAYTQCRWLTPVAWSQQPHTGCRRRHIRKIRRPRRHRSGR